MQFSKMKTFFPRNKALFFIILSNFSNVQSFRFFLPKNIRRAEKTFLRNITIWYAFYSKFTTFSDFWKIQDFFRKTLLFFLKKPQILNVLRNLTISVAFYGKFFTILWKKFDIQTREQPMLARLRELNWQTSGKKAPIWEEDFAFHIFNMAQNKKCWELQNH